MRQINQQSFHTVEIMMDMTVIPLENRWFAFIVMDESTQFSQEYLQLWPTPSYFLLYNNLFL